MSHTIAALCGLAVLCGASAPVATAQTGTGVTLGIMAGANLARLSVDPKEPGEEFGSRMGLLGGGFLGLRVHEAFSIEPQLLFSMKGAKASATDFPLEGTFKLNYLEVPVLARVRIPTRADRVRPVLFAGPSVGFQLSCQVEVSALGQSEEQDCKDTDANIKKTDFGMVFGAGVDVHVGKNVFRLEGRYGLGLTDINDPVEGAKIKNRVLAFTAGFGFALPR